MALEELDKNDFRNNLATADESGRRIWVYPRKPKGFFTSIRTKLSWFQLAFLAVAPFLSYNGHEVFLFNVFERRFVIFGITFWPQDNLLFVLATLSLFVGIALFTAVAGRVFCGWACPQTVFLEMLYRKVEYLIEGSHTKQRKLAESSMSFEKIWKKGLKHACFIVISIIIALVFTTYIIGRDGLLDFLQSEIAENMTGYLIVGAITAVLYWHFSFFREQFCTFLCPYARLQSVLLDNNSLVVAYDEKRGEPRGKSSRKKEPNLDEPKKGDCVDCNLCVQVCPTGIDIRNGFPQLECVNCTACIDACDNVMTTIRKPKGLIRYTSGNILEKGGKFRITPRIAVYSTFLIFLATALATMIYIRPEVNVDVLRKPGSLGKLNGALAVNSYKAEFVSSTYEDMEITLRFHKLNGQDTSSGVASFSPKNKVMVPAASEGELPFQLSLPLGLLKPSTNTIELGIYHNEELIDTLEVGFLRPRTK